MSQGVAAGNDPEPAERLVHEDHSGWAAKMTGLHSGPAEEALRSAVRKRPVSPSLERIKIKQV